MNKAMEILSTNQILCSFFPGRSIQELWMTCRCQMLWEAIRKDDAVIIPIGELPHLLSREASVIIAPEPLPAMYVGIEPAFKVVGRETILDGLSNYQDSPLVRCKSILEVEPMYLFSADLSWMIALTTENTPDRKRLCALVRKAV